jgi:hypothetical protein
MYYQQVNHQQLYQAEITKEILIMILANMELIFPNQPVNPTITQALGHYPTTPIRG